MSDSLEGMPEFDRPENIPLVVPDQGGPVEFDPTEQLPFLPPSANRCKGISFGKQCDMRLSYAKEFCFIHDPTPDQLAQRFASRLESFIQNCEKCGAATAEEVLTIATAVKAFGVLWDHKSNAGDVKKAIGVLEYKLVEPDARATA